MVLTETDILAEFPGADTDSEGGEYQDNEQAAEGTIDPDDTAEDLALLGRLDGFTVEFARGETLGGGVSVDLFDGPESAAAFLKRQIDDHRRLVGSEVQEGAVLKAFQESEGPDIGIDSAVGRLTISFVAFDVEINGTFVVWQRGSTVAQVIVGGLGDEDWTAVVEELARKVDRRIDRVLAGEVVAIERPREPTPIAVLPIAREFLAAVALTEAEVGAEFPDLELDRDATGYNDNRRAIEDTVDPDDTGSDLDAEGRLDGYEIDFSNITVLLQPEANEGQAFTLRAAVDLFSSPSAARAFIRSEADDYSRLAGTEVESGFSVKVFERRTAPNVGEEAIAARVSVSLDSVDVSGYYVTWRRGAVTGTVLVASVGEADPSGAVGRLAQLMDRRIELALAGEMERSTPPPVPIPAVDVEEIALSEGFNLPAMLPTIEDLSEGAVIQSEGFAEAEDALSSYSRTFGASGVVFGFGSSEISNMSVTIQLKGSEVEASGLVQRIESLTPDQFGELAGSDFAEDAGLTAENITAEGLELPEMGDAAAGFLLKIETSIADFDSYILFIARGRIFAFLSVAGPADQVSPRDVVSLAQLIDGRIQENSR